MPVCRLLSLNSLCGMFVYGELTSRVTRIQSNGRFLELVMLVENVLCLMYGGILSMTGQKWQLTNLEITSVVMPHHETIGLTPGSAAFEF